MMLLSCGVGEDSWESFGQQGDQTSPFYRNYALNIHWKDWCWSWSSNTLATWCKELTHWKRPWCWERLKAAGEGDNRGRDGCMTSPTQWTWVWASSGSWWWTGKPGVLQSMGSQRVGHDWIMWLNNNNLWWDVVHHIVSKLKISDVQQRQRDRRHQCLRPNGKMICFLEAGKIIAVSVCGGAGDG